MLIKQEQIHNEANARKDSEIPFRIYHISRYLKKHEKCQRETFVQHKNYSSKAPYLQDTKYLKYVPI